MILYLLIILISGIVAVKDLSKTIDGYIDIANPPFQFLTDCNRFRRSYGWNSLAGYGICMLSMLALFLVAVFRLFKALSRPALFWFVGMASILLLAGLLACWLTIRSKGSDQVEPLMEEKCRQELFSIIAQHSGQPIEKVFADCDRNYWMTAPEALQYGMIDQIMTKSK